MAADLIIPLLSIVFGIAVIIFPQFLRLIVGGYFILYGVLVLLLMY